MGKQEGIQLLFQALLYADDTLLKEDNEDQMQVLLYSIEEASKAFGLALNKKNVFNCQQDQLTKFILRTGHQ